MIDIFDDIILKNREIYGKYSSLRLGEIRNTADQVFRVGGSLMHRYSKVQPDKK